MRGGRRSLVLALGLACAVGCRKEAPPPASAKRDAAPADAAKKAVARTVAPRDAAADAALTPEHVAAARFEKIVCPKHECCVTEVADVGRDRRGRALTVVITGDDCIIPRGADSDETEEDEGTAPTCHDYHLVTEGDGARRARAQLLGEQCDHQKWEGGAQIDAQKQTLTISGGSLFSNDQTWSSELIGLNPVRTIETVKGSMSFHDKDVDTWNWDTFTGKLESGVDYCEGKRPRDAGPPQESDGPPIESVAVAIPRVTLPPAFVAGGWRRTGLGRCAALIDGKESGFTIHGEKSGGADSSLRVVLAAGSNDVYVEIADDELVTSAKTWVKEDHVELWASDGAAGESCVDPAEKSAARQWGVRLADGRVIPGFGDPPAGEAAEVARTGGTVRLKLPGTLLAGRPGLTVVYSDSDDGARQKRLIATSELSYGKAWTLGRIQDIEADDATCVQAGGALEPRVVSRRRPVR